MDIKNSFTSNYLIKSNLFIQEILIYVVCLVATQAAGGVSDLFQSSKDDTIIAVSDSAEVHTEVENNKNE